MAVSNSDCGGYTEAQSRCVRGRRLWEIEPLRTVGVLSVMRICRGTYGIWLLEINIAAPHGYPISIAALEQIRYPPEWFATCHRRMIAAALLE